jgi:ubiquinone/menaquinone biosynthesis C-methylase UbiE
MTTQQETRTAWDAIAAGFDAFVTNPGMPVADHALHHAGARPGMRLLDVASGSGAVSVPAARLGLHVLAVDLSPVMIELLEARARDEGLSNLKGRVMDGHSLDLEDETFDIAASQFGVMLFPDLPRALREMVRVTRSGGRVVVVTFAPPTRIEFLGFFLGALHATIPGFTGLPLDPPPLPFQIANPEVLRQRLAEAGLRDIRVEEGAELLELQSGKHLWNWVTHSNPIGAMLVADLTTEQEAKVQQTLDEMLRERSGGTGPAILRNPVYIGIGTK